MTDSWGGETEGGKQTNYSNESGIFPPSLREVIGDSGDRLE